MLYYRLLSTVRVWVYTIYLLAFIISGYSIALALALIFACRPIRKSWDPSITWGSCINRPGIYLATAVTNTVSDLALIVIPVRVIWRLRMRLVQKIGVIVMFGIGCL
jgi:energy-converting hydrogenase Eha subunit A